MCLRDVLRFTMKILNVFHSRRFVTKAAIVRPLPMPPRITSNDPIIIPNQRNDFSSSCGTENYFIKF